MLLEIHPVLNDAADWNRLAGGQEKTTCCRIHALCNLRAIRASCMSLSVMLLRLVAMRCCC